MSLETKLPAQAPLHARSSTASKLASIRNPTQLKRSRLRELEPHERIRSVRALRARGAVAAAASAGVVAVAPETAEGRNRLFADVGARERTIDRELDSESDISAAERHPCIVGDCSRASTLRRARRDPDERRHQHRAGHRSLELNARAGFPPREPDRSCQAESE